MPMRRIKPTGYGDMPMVASQKFLPSFSLTLKQFPGAKDWKVGDTYILEMKVRQTSLEQTKNSPGRVSFEIISVGEAETEEEEAAEESDEKDESYSRMKK